MANVQQLSNLNSDRTIKSEIDGMSVSVDTRTGHDHDVLIVPNTKISSLYIFICGTANESSKSNNCARNMEFTIVAPNDRFINMTV